jgi:hypothetical protein
MNEVMKRILFIVLAAMSLCGIAQAQVGVYRSSYGVSKQAETIGPITRQGSIYYYHDNPMSYAEMVNFVNSNCARAYQHYQTQKKIEIAGWSLFGTGLGFTVIGATILGVYGKNPKADGAQGTGIGFVCFGPITTLFGGVPMIIVANVRKRNLHKVYNTWCGYKELESSQISDPALELRLQSSANGLGLALNF